MQYVWEDFNKLLFFKTTRKMFPVFAHTASCGTKQWHIEIWTVKIHCQILRMLPFLGFFLIGIWDPDVNPSHHCQPCYCCYSFFAWLVPHVKAVYPPEHHGTVDVTRPGLSLALCSLPVTHTKAEIVSISAIRKDIKISGMATNGYSYLEKLTSALHKKAPLFN